jgi:uncharacterized membrane protein HdeD (DUF308 family)
MNTKALRICTLIMGIMVMGFGIIMLFTPMETYTFITILIPIAIFMHGISSLITYITAGAERAASGWLLADGILSIIVGVWLFFITDITAMALPFIFGFWVLFAGVLRIMGAVSVRKITSKWGWLLFFGVVGIITGVFLLNHPIIAGAIIAFLTAWGFVFMGILVITQFFVMKNEKVEVETMPINEPELNVEVDL